MSEKIWSDDAWDDYLYWQIQDKKTLKRINILIKDIERNGALVGTGRRDKTMHIGRITIIALACVLMASFSIAATNSGYREEDAADVQDWSSFVGVYPNEKLVRAFTGEKNSDSDLVVEFSARRMAMFIYTPTQAQDTQDDISMSGTVSIDGKPAKSITLLGQVADRVAFFEVNDRALPGIVQEMAQGRQVRFTINPVFGGKPTKLTFSLAGFASAFTRAVGLSQKHFGHRQSIGEYFRTR